MVGEFLVEPDIGCLSRGHDVVRVQLRVMDVLLRLAARSPRLVTRRQLMDTVWQDNAVCENTLNHAVSELRAALGDDSRHPRYVETVHRRGYRLLAPVSDTARSTPVNLRRPACYRIATCSRDIQLREGVNIVGSAPRVSVLVDEPGVAPQHAVIIIHGTIVVIEDLGSRDGTIVNGRPIVGPQPLHDGDRIQLGQLTSALQFHSVRTHRAAATHRGLQTAGQEWVS